MAQFTHSLCEEVIRTDGRCGLTRNEMVQMARLALRTLDPDGPIAAEQREVIAKLSARPEARRSPEDIIGNIVADICSRKGLSHEWESIDDEIRDEIVAEWLTFFAPSPLRRITEESAPVWCQMCGKGVGDGMVSCLRIGCPIVGTPMNNSEGSK